MTICLMAMGEKGLYARIQQEKDLPRDASLIEYESEMVTNWSISRWDNDDCALQ